MLVKALQWHVVKGSPCFVYLDNVAALVQTCLVHAVKRMTDGRLTPSMAASCEVGRDLLRVMLIPLNEHDLVKCSGTMSVFIASIKTDLHGC